MKQKEPIFNFAEPSIPILIAVFAIIHFLGFAFLGIEKLYYNFALFPLGSPELNVGPIKTAYSVISYGFIYNGLGSLIMAGAGLLIFGLITFRSVRASTIKGKSAFLRFWTIFWSGVIIGALFQWGYWSASGISYDVAVGATGGVSALFATTGWAVGGIKRMSQFAMAFALLTLILLTFLGNFPWAINAGGFIAGAGLAPYWVKPDSAGTSIFR